MKIKDLFPTGRALGAPVGSIRLFFDPSAMIAASAGTTNAIIGAAGSIYGSNSAVSDSRSARDYDAAKTIQARNWQQQDQVLALQEAQRAREYSTKEREAEQAFIAHQNSVHHQVAQMLAAGINPASVFGQAGSGGQIGSAPTNPSVAHAALAGAPIVGNPVSSFSRSAAIRDMAVALQSLNSSGSELVKSLSSARKIDSEVNLLVSQSHNEEQKAAYSKALAHATDAKLPGDLRKQVVEITNLIAQGDLAKADAELKKLQAMYTDTQDKYLALQLPFVTSNLQAAFDLKQSEIETEKARAAHEKASASHELELAHTERETRNPRVRMYRAQASIEEAREAVEANPSVIADKLALVRSQLQRDMFESEAEYKEVLRRLDHAKNILDNRNMNIATKTFDDVMLYIGDQIGNALRVLK